MSQTPFDKLDTALAEIGSIFQDPEKRERAEYTAPALATHAQDDYPSVRHLILRSVDLGARHMDFFSDLRSTKVRELNANPRAGLLFYNRTMALQTRLDGTVTLHADDDVADLAWPRVREAAYRAYTSPKPSGVPIEDPSLAFGFSEKNADLGPGARKNFVVLRFGFDRLEWLKLDPDGNKRAIYTWANKQQFSNPAEFTWIIP